MKVTNVGILLEEKLLPKDMLEKRPKLLRFQEIKIKRSIKERAQAQKIVQNALQMNLKRQD